MSCHVTSCHAMSCHVTSCHTMPCHASAPVPSDRQHLYAALWLGSAGPCTSLWCTLQPRKLGPEGAVPCTLLRSRASWRKCGRSTWPTPSLRLRMRPRPPAPQRGCASGCGANCVHYACSRWGPSAGGRVLVRASCASVWCYPQQRQQEALSDSNIAACMLCLCGGHSPGS